MRFFLKLFTLLFLLVCSTTVVKAQQKAKKDSTKNVNFAAIPVINYNNSLGTMVGGMASMFYKLNPNDTISPSSSTMLAGIYTSNKSWMGIVLQKFYFAEDKWRAKLIGGTGVYYFQYFQGLPSGPGRALKDGIWIDFDTEVKFLMAEVQRKVLSDFYVGLEAIFANANTTFDITIGPWQPKEESDINSLGYTFLYDNRDNVNFPVKGLYLNYKNRFIRDWIGSTENYDNYEVAFNHFWDIKKNSKSVLVSRLYANIAAGDVPFQGQSHIGGDDLRGYSKGEFRGNQVYTIQTELRQNVYKKFGMVGFVGIGSAVDKIGDIPHEDLLPGFGIGLRYLMIEKEKINIGVDVGVGKNDWSLTFRIGEAFSR